MRIHGIHDNADGKGAPSGCGVYRIIFPLAELGRHGHDTTWRCGRPPASRTECDVIVGQRFDNPDVLPEWRRFRVHSRLVYEIDDNIWSVPRANWMAYRTYSQESCRDAVETAAAIADVVTVTTEPLAEILRKFNPEVRVVPNVIPGELLAWERPDSSAGKPRRTVTVGWRGGASHALDVQVAAPAVRKVLRSCPWARLHVVGTDFRPSFGVPDAMFTNWVPVDEKLAFYRSILGFDINLAPLAGIEFDYSKSNISALEAAALGIPTIATDLPPYHDFIEDGVTGYLVRKPAEWAKRLRELVSDADARREMGTAARDRAKAWTIESCWPRWARVYEELIT